LNYYANKELKKDVTPEDLNPMRAGNKEADFAETMAWAESQELPKYTSEEDIEARWQEHLRSGK